MVTYNWERGKGTGCGRVGADIVILVVDVITLRLSRFWRCTLLADVNPEMHEAKCNVLHGLIPFHERSSSDFPVSLFVRFLGH